MAPKTPEFPATSKDLPQSQEFTLCNHGPDPAPQGAMPRIIDIQIGPKQPKLTPPKVQVLPTREDALWVAKRDINHLKNEISRLESKIRRMKEDLEYEIAGWKEALEAGKRQESIEAIRRRISRLTGACDFQGTIDYDSIDREL
jgi:hypothetical protein